MRRSTSAVMTPTPGPYSTITRARLQSTGLRSSRRRRRELGTIEPSMSGWRKKLRAKSRARPPRVAGVTSRSWFTSFTSHPRSGADSYCTASTGRRSQVDSYAAPRCSATGALRLVAESRELRNQPVAVLALDLDRAILDCAAGAAQALEACGELLERRLPERQSADHRDAL